jgi:hypothetical protein
MMRDARSSPASLTPDPTGSEVHAMPHRSAPLAAFVAALALAALPPLAAAGVNVLEPDSSVSPGFSVGDHVEFDAGVSFPLFTEPVDVDAGWSAGVGYEHMLAAEFGIVVRGEFTHMTRRDQSRYTDGRGAYGSSVFDDATERADLGSVAVGGRFQRSNSNGAAVGFTEGMIGAGYSRLRPIITYDSELPGYRTEEQRSWRPVFSIAIGTIYQPTDSPIGFLIEAQLISHIGDEVTTYLPIRFGVLFHHPRKSGAKPAPFGASP